LNLNNLLPVTAETPAASEATTDSEADEKGKKKKKKKDKGTLKDLTTFACGP
jgi:hypothetical protein